MAFFYNIHNLCKSQVLATDFTQQGQVHSKKNSCQSVCLIHQSNQKNQMCHINEVCYPKIHFQSNNYFYILSVIPSSTLLSLFMIWNHHRLHKHIDTICDVNIYLYILHPIKKEKRKIKMARQRYIIQSE